MTEKRRSLKQIKQAFKRIDLSRRGSDQEYAAEAEAIARELEPYRRRAERASTL